MAYRLWSVAALALVGLAFVDGVQVCAQADLACPHLGDNRADRSVCARVDLEHVLSRLGAEPVEVPAVFRVLPGHVPLILHPRADVGFRGGHQGPQGRWFRLLRVLFQAGNFFSCLVGRLVTGDSNMYRDPSELQFPSMASELVECLDGLRQDILS